MAYKNPEDQKKCRRRCYLRNREKEIAAALDWRAGNKVRYNKARQAAKKRKANERILFDLQVARAAKAQRFPRGLFA